MTHLSAPRIQIHTLRTTAHDCGEGRVCPSVHQVSGDDENLYVVSKKCTEPGEAAAFAHLLEPGETVGWMPAGFLPPEADVLARAGAASGPDLRADRQYVISSRVVDELLLNAFADLMDPDSEQLGTTLTRQLQGV